MQEFQKYFPENKFPEIGVRVIKTHISAKICKYFFVSVILYTEVGHLDQISTLSHHFLWFLEPIVREVKCENTIDPSFSSYTHTVNWIMHFSSHNIIAMQTSQSLLYLIESQISCSSVSPKTSLVYKIQVAKPTQTETLLKCKFFNLFINDLLSAVVI